MATMRLADDLASLHARAPQTTTSSRAVCNRECGVQACPWLHRQQGGRPVQRLDLRFFVDTQFGTTA